MAGSSAWAWLDGEYLPWAEAKIHVRTECVMRGGSVFEGVPGYWSAAQGDLFLFRLEAHMRRLEASMRVMRMQLPYSLAVLENVVSELVRRCDFREDIHVRPTVYFGVGSAFGFKPAEIEVGAFVTATPMPRVEGRAEAGIRMAVSSWTRNSEANQPPRVKASGSYLNGRFAQVQAVVDGYDGAILLSRAGHVAEGPAACLMMVKGGVISTPRLSDGILDSITRSTLIECLGRELELRVEERAIGRTELYIADELFECGSGHEITPIVAVDRFPVGDGRVGPVTRRTMELYRRIVRGEMTQYRSWLTPVFRTAD